MKQASLAELSAAVISERAGLEALVEVLRVERQALDAGDTDRVARLVPRKRELLLHIAHMGEQRNRLLERCGVTPDRRGMERLLATDSSAAECRMEWGALIELTQQAQALNPENGALIEANMHVNQQALATLASASRSSGTYSPAGRNFSPVAPRSLASA